MTSEELGSLAERYAQAWCGQHPESVAAFFTENGSLTVNNSAPALGRAAIAEIAGSFMRDFPDMVVAMDEVTNESAGAHFHWTLSGTHRETGNHVRISGYELWKIGTDGLIVESKGHFDAAEYERQLRA